MTTVGASAWVPPYIRPNPAAHIRLFCFPYAGAGASIFRLWTQRLGSEFELWPMQLPGRENRMSEPCMTAVEEVADGIAHDPALRFEGRFAFFGHSLGAIIAYEVARRLQRIGRRQPGWLFVSAHRAPQVPLPHPPTWNLSHEDFERRLIELNGTPREIFQDKALLEVLLPVVRADFRLDETYVHADEHERLSCPLTVFGGTRDDEVPAEQLEAWRQISSGKFELRMFNGDHFFFHSHATAVIDAVAQMLRRLSLEALTDSNPGF